MSSPADRLVDLTDHILCRTGLGRVATWDDLLAERERRLYAGRLYRGLPQYGAYYGLTPYWPSSRNIPHDITKPLPIPDGSITVYQSEDVFEHVPFEALGAVFDEIHRVLKPGGLFRLSVPDYRNSIYSSRSVRGADGRILFDPSGGGKFVGDEVIDGGHLWFPVYESVLDLFEASLFKSHGRVEFLHFHPDGAGPVVKPIDYAVGYVQRTPDHDPRVRSTGEPLSIVVDAYKAG